MRVESKPYKNLSLKERMSRDLGVNRLRIKRHCTQSKLVPGVEEDKAPLSRQDPYESTTGVLCTGVPKPQRGLKSLLESC